MPAAGLPGFDPDDYRRRVLAEVHRRGGAEHSDPFEIYDIPLAVVDALDDGQVRLRIAEVWAFWQRSRDHPRYRGVIIGLLDRHTELAAALADHAGRRALRDRVAAARAQRDDERFAALDAAAHRLVARFGGLPGDRIEGLRAWAATEGIEAAAFDARIRRHRVLPVATARPGAKAARSAPIPPAVLRQIRSGLDELGRIAAAAPPRSLFDLLGVPPDTPKEQIRARRDAAVARNRARRPDRRRALVDDLLTAVGALLVDGDPQAYLDALAAETTARLRPRVAAAVLVEDTLLPAVAAELVAEARADGLDLPRARAVVRTLASEHGVAAGSPPGTPATAVAPGPAASPVTGAADPATSPGNVADALPAPVGLRFEADRLRWAWPAGCTEVMVVARTGEAPRSAADADAFLRKVTNARYDIDGGVALPAERPLHVAVFCATRLAGRLVVATTAGARLRLPASPAASGRGS
ncbi:Fibronectin type-III domain-containing protein [Frankia sp. AiPs1]|uniref:hypothetical protein n=1 Tax=Frankia sp. AiPa1 TaxID=573492 RepID=UPI0027E3F36A|nr:hypothetical protein [Frankia sp. AiPa1]